MVITGNDLLCLKVAGQPAEGHRFLHKKLSGEHQATSHLLLSSQSLGCQIWSGHSQGSFGSVELVGLALG